MDFYQKSELKISINDEDKAVALEAAWGVDLNPTVNEDISFCYCRLFRVPHSSTDPL